MDEYWNAVSYPITQGHWMLVDIDDYSFVSKRKWQIKYGCGIMKYARASFVMDGKRRNKCVHQILINAPKGMVIDHKNGNGLDNRRQNLRVCTYSQNGCNKKRTNRYKETSKFKGVTWYGTNKYRKWLASITINKKTIYLGFFHTDTEAAMAFDKAALIYHGEFAYLNFGNEHYEKREAIAREL
jgi:hypothetical protein